MAAENMKEAAFVGGVKRFPMMLASSWIDTESQPIAIDNVIHYLLGVLQKPETAGQVYDIGGPQVVSWRDLIEIYAQEAGLRRRLIISVPFFTPRFHGLWIRSLTPYRSDTIHALMESLANRMVCQDNRIRQIIPQDLLDCRQAIRLTIGKA